MGIISIYTDTAGQVSVNPRRVKLITTDNLSAITTANYLGAEAISTYAISPTDIFDVIYNYVIATNTGSYGIFLPTFSNGIVTLSQASASGVTLPTIANHFAIWSNTTGNLTEDVATAIQGGNIQAGLSGTAGYLASFPSTAASGQFQFKAANSAGNYTAIFTHASLGQASTWTLADPASAASRILQAPAALVSGNIPSASGVAGLVVDSGVVANRVLYTSFATPDVNSNVIRFDVTVTAAALAAGGLVALITSGGSRQYKISALWTNSGGTNFSGGGGDRLLTISDGTTAYTVIPAASLGTLANVGWGDGAGLPYPAAAAINTSTVAGQNLRALYSGGTTDYAAGSVVISGIAQRVA